MAHRNPDPRQKKALRWVGRSHEYLMEFPLEVMKDIGTALGVAQFGDVAPTAKRWMGNPGVFEIVAAHDGNAYRAVYAAAFEQSVYVLHAFQKKSPDGGAKTDRRDVAAVESALRGAIEHYKAEMVGD